MGSGLPFMLKADGVKKQSQIKFGGYNHNLSASEGDLWDMRNLSSDHYPLLSSRLPRYLIRRLEKPNGFTAHDGLYYVDGTTFYADGVPKGEVSDTRKWFVNLGVYLVIMPDKKYYNRINGEFGSMESEFHGAVEITDGSFAGERAEANTIYAAGVNFGEYFHAGDAVTITGCTTHESNNKTPIIREIEGEYLRFYENVFIIAEGGDNESEITISRTVPDMDYMCENENRLWGCKGDTIYASKPGDIFNWNVFDGLASDSYAVSVGSAEDFTGCVSYLGYPVFFKESSIYKVYGSKPSNFEVMRSASLGIEEGSFRSPAVAGEILFYLSRTGIVSYSGGIPINISAAFGTDRYINAVGGSDGQKYYVSMRKKDGGYVLFVYDTLRGVWHKEDELEIMDFGWNGDLYYLCADGRLWMNGNARTVPAGAELENEVPSMAEFGDFYNKDPNKKGSSKLQIRVELDEGARVTVSMRFDSDDTWHEVSTIETSVKRSYYLPIIPRRSDHYRIKIEGSGGWRLYSLTREDYTGSEL